MPDDPSFVLGNLPDRRQPKLTKEYKSAVGMPIEKSSERPTNNTNATQDERLAALALLSVQAELDVDPADTGMSF